MQGDIQDRVDHEHKRVGDETHRVDDQLPGDDSSAEGALIDNVCNEYSDYDDSDDDEAFESMIKVIRVAQCGGIEPSFLSAIRGQNLQPDNNTTPGPQLMITEDGETCINPYTIPKQVPREPSRLANYEESSDSDEEDFDFKQHMLVGRLLPRMLFTMETQAVATMVLLDMDWYFVGYYPCQLDQPIMETCLAILFVFDKIGMHTKAKEDLPLSKEASKGNIKRAYIDVVKNWLFKNSVFGAIAKNHRIADDIARWKKHHPMLFDDPNNVLKGWEP